MLGGAEVGYVLQHSGAVGLLAQDALLGAADEAVDHADAAPACGCAP